MRLGAGKVRDGFPDDVAIERPSRAFPEAGGEVCIEDRRIDVDTSGRKKGQKACCGVGVGLCDVSYRHVRSKWERDSRCDSPERGTGT